MDPNNLTEPNESEMISTESDDSDESLTGHIHPAAADVTVDETHEPLFQTPEPPPRHQTATNTEGPRQALFPFTGAEQTTPPTTAVRPREEEEEEQREAETLDMKAKQDNKRAELQQKIRKTELKMAEEKSSVFNLKVSLDNGCLQIYNVFSEVKKVVEAALQRSLQPLKEWRELVEREGEDLLQRLERETEELQKTLAELDRNPDIPAELQQRIQITERKMAEVKSSVEGLNVRLATECEETYNVFSKVTKVVDAVLKKALQPLKERRERVTREGEDLLKELERETLELQKTISLLDIIPDHQISLDETNTSLDTSFSFGSLRTTTSALIEQIELQLEELSSSELRRFPTCAGAVDVKLDPATAHPCLTLSDDGKEVRGGGTNQEVHDTPERFDILKSVLGLNGLTSGRSYWEVEVGNKTGWDLGVARGDANRKGNVRVNPDNGYWAITYTGVKNISALTAPRVLLSLRDKPQKVGVFVDYEEGLVSFYDMTARSHIYSFTQCAFGGEIFPYFSPHLQQNGQNAAPLIISPVERQ